MVLVGSLRANVRCRRESLRDSFSCAAPSRNLLLPFLLLVQSVDHFARPRNTNRMEQLPDWTILIAQEF